MAAPREAPPPPAGWGPQKRIAEVAERRFFPGASFTYDELIKDPIAQARRDHELKYPGQPFRPYRYKIVIEWFKRRKAASITPEEISKKLAEHLLTVFKT